MTLSPTFITKAVAIVKQYIDEDPNDIGNAFLCALYSELTGQPDVHMREYFTTIEGRYRIPRMKAILGSTIELLKMNEGIASAHHLVELLHQVRGPELTGAEFINELMINGFIWE